ncbi:tyrosine-type recombinase/integrase [Vibrio aestuarianus subsp. cardii]|uniref:integrase domain-containing protein n=1 Tax=Vibrio aestuarianus TaxID=28171 RepID=UPI001592C500|nr:integrase domain-containing protein [Vibrio aestuarianus]MDE1309032.1 integrase domain-containing protein [Vibrio aestuarianus]MDE1331577.1 integrase domain-containing protein [Vibrio aestuarianus]NGZ91020.1 tyrosine-type recombinase/integrase [Vibrio aestuarianus subsp. cardii]
MGTRATRLTSKAITNAKPKEKDYVLSDGDGLQLRVRTNGSRLWNFNYRHPITKKRINMGLGAFPELSLANARKKTIEARELVADGIDPKEARDSKLSEMQKELEDTLLNLAKEWFERKKESVTPNYADDIWRSLELHVFPQIANTPVKDIDAPLVIDLLRPIEAKGSLETVKRLSQRLNEIMNYAANCGLVKANPLTGIRAAFKKPKKENMAALAPDELPELMGAIANASIKRTTRCLIEWQLHTMTRPSEAAGARWDEIEWEENIWTIPAERMKKRREHRIPLTEQMLALLEVIKPISGHREYIFPSDRDPKKPCNSQTANMALKRMGFAGRLVSHGLRSLASTTLNEQGFDRDLIEASLAHVDDNQVRSAYNRTDYLERRRPMMSWWSGHIEEAAKGSLSVTGTKQLKVI